MTRPRTRVGAIALATAIAGLACGDRARTTESSTASGTTSAPLATVSASPPAPPIDADAIRRDAEGQKRMMADITYLASDALEGRLTGSPGARLASTYIAKRFTELGLLPFGDTVDGARGFDKNFIAEMRATVGPTKLEVSNDSGDLRALSPGDFHVVDGSATGDVTGDAVFVGFGIESREYDWDDYGDADLTGKVAVALRGGPERLSTREFYEIATFRSKITVARRHHAIALVVVATKDELPALPTDAESGGIPAVAMKKSAATRAFAPFDAASSPVLKASKPSPPSPIAGVKIHVATSISSSGGEPTNDVVALLPARDDSPTKDEYVLVGGHYDHLGWGGDWKSRSPHVHAIHHGADDNASGTSLVLEVAHRFAKLPQRPERNVVFVTFSGEELGLLGSRAWVDDPPIPLAKITGLVNSDMVGRLRDDKVIADTWNESPPWAPLFTEANNGLALVFTYGLPADVGGSDHETFIGADVPVAFLFTGLHDDYHRPSDTPDKINADGLEKIATFATRLVARLTEGGLPMPAR